MARELTPDLVLMDVNLPGINGLDATRQILAGAGDSVVVLLLSTYEEEEYAPRAAECGAAAYIPKAVFGPDRLERPGRPPGGSRPEPPGRGGSAHVRTTSSVNSTWVRDRTADRRTSRTV